MDKARRDQKQVYGLSFHVDYWNYIGWKDPYSSQYFSQRQRNYSKGIAAHRVYTPQMIVNGREEFVGSDKDKATQAITVALQQLPKYKLSISEVLLYEDQVTFSYSIDKDPSRERLNVALVQRNIENFVPRGENHGKTLRHDNVVRKLESLELKKSGKLTLSLVDVKPFDCSIILYIQQQDLAIVGAAAYDLVASK